MLLIEFFLIIILCVCMAMEELKGREFVFPSVSFNPRYLSISSQISNSWHHFYISVIVFLNCVTWYMLPGYISFRL